MVRVTEGETGSCSDGLMGGAIVSKSLIQFSVDGWGCVPSLLFDLRPNYCGGSEDNSDLLQKVPCTAVLSVPRLYQATANPCLHQRLLETHRQVWVSFLWGHCSSFLHKYFICAFQESVPPVLCKFWGSMMGLMVSSSKSAYAIPSSAVPRAPAPEAGHC